MKSEPGYDHVAFLARRTGLPLDDAQIEALREGHELLQQLRAQLRRPAEIDTDLALAFVPEFGQ